MLTYVVLSRTSTMCPELIRPPLDMLWISVSSRSRISVFWCLMSAGSALMYDGCRRGISGRGGAGVLGYLVSAPAGEVGDFSCAEMSPVGPPDPAPLPLARALADCAFLCFRCRRASSECSFILIDRRAGAISSVSCSDLDRKCLPLLP